MPRAAAALTLWQPVLQTFWLSRIPAWAPAAALILASHMAWTVLNPPPSCPSQLVTTELEGHYAGTPGSPALYLQVSGLEQRAVCVGRSYCPRPTDSRTSTRFRVTAEKCSLEGSRGVRVHALYDLSSSETRPLFNSSQLRGERAAR